MLLDAAAQALEEAQYRKFDLSRTGIVVGTIFGSEFINQLSRCLGHPEFELLFRPKWVESGLARDQADRLLESFRARFLAEIPVLSDESGGFSASTLASRIARTFDLMGGAWALETRKREIVSLFHFVPGRHKRMIDG